MARLHPVLQPYKPSAGDPFDRVKAAHLLNRAGFGGTQTEIERVLKLGPQDAVDWLLDFPAAAAEEQSQSDVPDLSGIENYPRDYREMRTIVRGMSPEERMEYRQKLQQANREAVFATGGWWVRRMAEGAYPLQEKLALFWHGHFTTSARDERSAWLMWQQNELLRRQSAGNFKQFVREIARDPAMLDYLNNQQNRKRSPNENFARELMELFTLGIGNYTEQDIKEAARAFTGWAHDGDGFIFRKYDHDTDEKTFFGHSGNFDGDDIIEIIFQHPACAPYIAGKIFGHFVYQADSQLTESLGGVLRESDWELRPLLRTIFTSKAFYSEPAIGSQIKSPIQLVVGTVRMLEIEAPPQRGIWASLQQMGQVPLDPPNVKGWPGGRMWINTSTLFVRYNTAVWLAGGGNAVASGRKGVDLANRMRGAVDFAPKAEGSPDEIVDYWTQRLIQRPVDAEKRKHLLETLSTRPNEETVRKMVQLIVSMPEYQLC